MVSAIIWSVGALFGLMPAAVLAVLGRRDGAPAEWAGTALAIAAAIGISIVSLQGAWNSGFAVSLWLIVTATLAAYAALRAFSPSLRRLAPVLHPYLCALGLLATIWTTAPSSMAAPESMGAWLIAHITVALAAYALITLAAVAAAAVAVQEWALKARRPSRLTRLLPAVADAERLQWQLLAAGEAVLGAGLLSGMAAAYVLGEPALRFDHKTLLVVATLVVIGAILLSGVRSGLRGRSVARGVLLAYLLLTLGYPGVKFVTDVLMS